MVQFETNAFLVQMTDVMATQSTQRVLYFTDHSRISPLGIVSRLRRGWTRNSDS
jgi:putative AlgH/UPF0301 family transcriptional regulator